jgi:hypothetical protein
VVEIVELRGGTHLGQHAAPVNLLRGKWECPRIAFDATGPGAAPCQMLARALGTYRVVPFVFTTAEGLRPSSFSFVIEAPLYGANDKDY